MENIDKDKEKKLQELLFRRSLCQNFINILETELADRPEQPSALETYREQLGRIQKKIDVLEGKPPDIVIGLKTATLSGKVQK